MGKTIFVKEYQIDDDKYDIENIILTLEVKLLNCLWGHNEECIDATRI